VSEDRTGGAPQDPAGVGEVPGTTDIKLIPLDAERAHQPPRPHGWKATASKILHFVAAIFLFILAIQLMKASAAPIGARLKQTGLIDNAVMTLGFGWFGAYIVLSGSPVAAVALTFFSEGVLTPLQTFTMLSGSRLGASFIVLLVGFLYSVRNKDRQRTIGMGVLALSMTAIVYIPGMMLGYLILREGLLKNIHWQASSELTSIIKAVWGPIVDFISRWTPAPLLFPIGLAVILISFKLLDRVLPEIDPERHAGSKHLWMKKPWPMFGLGCLAALLTLSVSVALTVLVPLAAKGYVKRREAIPYIAGANITTLADTLVAAMITGHPVAVQIVLAEAIAVALITVIYLGFFYKPIVNGIIKLDDWVVETNRRLYMFVVALFLVPAMLVGIGKLIGPVG
jgi:Na+/phosphate symporter